MDTETKEDLWLFLEQHKTKIKRDSLYPKAFPLSWNSCWIVKVNYNLLDKLDPTG